MLLLPKPKKSPAGHELLETGEIQSQYGYFRCNQHQLHRASVCIGGRDKFNYCLASNADASMNICHHYEVNPAFFLPAFDD